MESVLNQIEYYQDKLDFLESPLLNPKIYYINFTDYQTEGESDVNQYKNYEKLLDEKIRLLLKMANERKITIHRKLNITVFECIPYVDVNKVKDSLLLTSISNT